MTLTVVVAFSAGTAVVVALPTACMVLVMPPASVMLWRCSVPADAGGACCWAWAWGCGCGCALRPAGAPAVSTATVQRRSRRRPEIVVRWGRAMVGRVGRLIEELWLGLAWLGLGCVLVECSKYLRVRSVQEAKGHRHTIAPRSIGFWLNVLDLAVCNHMTMRPRKTKKELARSSNQGASTGSLSRPNTDEQASKQTNNKSTILPQK